MSTNDQQPAQADVPGAGQPQSSISTGNISGMGIAIGHSARTTVINVFLPPEQHATVAEFVANLPPFDNAPPDIPELVDLFPPADTLLGRMDELVALLGFFERTRTQRTGVVSIVAGPPGSGRLALLRALALHAEAHDATALLVRFLPEDDADRAGARALYQADAALADPDLFAREDAIAAAFPKSADLAGWGWVRLMAQAAGVLGIDPRPAAPYGDDPRALLPLLRDLARRGPLIVALAHLDMAPPPWLELLTVHAAELLADQPLLLVAAIAAPAPLNAIPAEEQTAVQRFAINLTGRVASVAFFLDPVTAPEVEATLGSCASPIADELVALADGHVATMESIWSAWTEAAVDWDDMGERWVVVDPGLPLGVSLRDHSRAWMEQLLAGEDETPRLDKVATATLLWTAAQEGRIFSVQAAARALGVEDDIALETCDLLLGNEETPGLLAEVGLVPLQFRTTDTWPARYRFSYLYLHRLWRRDEALGVDRQPAPLRAALADALEQLYYPQTDLVAEALVRLFVTTGQRNRAQPYRERQERAASIGQLSYQITLLAPFATTRIERYRLFRLRIALAGKLREAGRYREGVVPARAALDDALALADELSEALACGWLGALLQDLGELAAARPYYERALAIREAVLGPQHPGTATSLNNLAWLSHDEGNIAEAVALMRRALAIRETALGPQHPDTQATRRSLAAFEAQLRGEPASPGADDPATE